MTLKCKSLNFMLASAISISLRNQNFVSNNAVFKEDFFKKTFYLLEILNNCCSTVPMVKVLACHKIFVHYMRMILTCKSSFFIYRCFQMPLKQLLMMSFNLGKSLKSRQSVKILTNSQVLNHWYLKFTNY